MSGVLNRLCELAIAPSQKEAFDSWLKAEDAIAFLTDNAQQDEFVVYASIEHTFIHMIFVPASLTNPPDIDDLLSWDFNATSSWGISYTFSEPPEVSISPPLDNTRSKTLHQGEQLVFARFFEGRMGNKNYFEVLQKLVHIFDLHFLPERNAYCRLDKHGDIEDVIRIVTIPVKGETGGGTIVLFKRQLLDEYMVLTESVIVRMFDFTRYRPSHFYGWSHTPDAKQITDVDLAYRSAIEPGNGSYTRGCQIVRPLMSKEAVIRRHGPTQEEDRQYASFIAHDWKNKIVREISCAPGHTANYFTNSDLPFELSPAFFRPEVLAKYKADSEKYRLGDGSISCRGAWHLETYDINDAGQVHTYIVYLRRLPYEEQLYWKAHNERPKGPISNRAFTTDFEGRWDLEYDPLISLKHALRELNRQQVPWWRLRAEKLLDQVHYPVTSSADEWANEILQLDQLVVEGFEEKWLRQKAQSLGREPDHKLRSLKLMEECLMALGFEEDHARKITAPFHKVHYLRSKVKGHASNEEATAIKQEVLTEYGSYKTHFRVLCGECDESIQTITNALLRNGTGVPV